MGKAAKGITGGITNAVLGKKVKGTSDRYMPLDPLQKKALDQYGKMLGDVDSMARVDLSKMENQIQSNAMDVERKAKDMVAQRGLGGSASGLNAILNATRGMGDQVANARAGLTDLKFNRLNNATNGIQSILNSRAFIQGTPGGGRAGGLAPLIGAGMGAAFAPPGAKGQGAALGMGLGNAFSQAG